MFFDANNVCLMYACFKNKVWRIYYGHWLWSTDIYRQVKQNRLDARETQIWCGLLFVGEDVAFHAEPSRLLGRGVCFLARCIWKVGVGNSPHGYIRCHPVLCSREQKEAGEGASYAWDCSITEWTSSPGLCSSLQRPRKDATVFPITHKLPENSRLSATVYHSGRDTDEGNISKNLGVSGFQGLT